jgi:hypothetical protein
MAASYHFFDWTRWATSRQLQWMRLILIKMETTRRQRIWISLSYIPSMWFLGKVRSERVGCSVLLIPVDVRFQLAECAGLLQSYHGHCQALARQSATRDRVALGAKHCATSNVRVVLYSRSYVAFRSGQTHHGIYWCHPDTWYPRRHWNIATIWSLLHGLPQT